MSCLVSLAIDEENMFLEMSCVLSKTHKKNVFQLDEEPTCKYIQAGSIMLNTQWSMSNVDA